MDYRFLSLWVNDFWNLLYLCKFLTYDVLNFFLPLSRICISLFQLFYFYNHQLYEFSILNIIYQSLLDKIVVLVSNYFFEQIVLGYLRKEYSMVTTVSLLLFLKRESYLHFLLNLGWFLGLYLHLFDLLLLGLCLILILSSLDFLVEQHVCVSCFTISSTKALAFYFLL